MASPKRRAIDSSDADSQQRPSKVIRSVEMGPSGLDNVITINVGTGDGRASFILHEGLIRGSSKFIDVALKHDLKGSLQRTVNVPETSLVAFAVYAKFLLMGFLFLKEMSDDFLDATDFRDAISDGMLELFASINEVSEGVGAAMDPPVRTVDHIYEHSEHGMPIRKLFVDICLHARTDASHYELKKLNEQSTGFLRDFLQAASPYIISNKSNKDMPNPIDSLGTCKYNKHVLTRQPCYKTKRQYLDAPPTEPEHPK